MTIVKWSKTLIQKWKLHRTSQSRFKNNWFDLASWYIFHQWFPLGPSDLVKPSPERRQNHHHIVLFYERMVFQTIIGKFLMDHCQGKRLAIWKWVVTHTKVEGEWCCWKGKCYTGVLHLVWNIGIEVGFTGLPLYFSICCGLLEMR